MLTTLANATTFSAIAARPSVEVAPPARRAAALWLAFSELPRDERLGQAAALMAASARGELALDNLLMARRNGRLVGASLAIATEGAAAQLWPAQILAEEPESTVGLLLAEHHRRLGASGVRFIQAFTAPEASRDGERLRAAGYIHACDLVWLACRVGSLADANSPAAPEFSPFDGDFARMSSIVDRTYIDTLDCPSLNHARDTADVLQGYASAATFRTDRWFYVRHAGSDVGCLLLTDQPTGEQMELVYCGLAPEWRGRGWGRQLSLFAQFVARRDGRKRLMLAVDSANHHALATYAAVGMTAYDRRAVFAKTLAS